MPTMYMLLSLGLRQLLEKLRGTCGHGITQVVWAQDGRPVHVLLSYVT